MERLNHRGEGGNVSHLQERKTSVYFKGETLQQIRETAAALDRSVSWVLTKAFQLSLTELEAMGARGEMSTDIDDQD